MNKRRSSKGIKYLEKTEVETQNLKIYVIQQEKFTEELLQPRAVEFYTAKKRTKLYKFGVKRQNLMKTIIYRDRSQIQKVKYHIFSHMTQKDKGGAPLG